MLRFLSDCINDLASGNIFKPIERIAGLLLFGVRHPIKALKTIVPLLGLVLVVVIIRKCSNGG